MSLTNTGPTTVLPGDPKSGTFLMFIIMSNLERGEESAVEKWWHPPMTADGTQMKLALDIEKICRSLWKNFAPPKPPPFRSPSPTDDAVEHQRLENVRVLTLLERRSALRIAMQRIADSDSVFSILPDGAHKTLHQLRALVKSISDRG